MEESEPEQKTRKKKCILGTHQDRILRGGKRVECTVCQDTFPCTCACEHFDCMLATGRELPDWVTFNMSDAPAVIAEAMGGPSEV